MPQWPRTYPARDAGGGGGGNHVNDLDALLTIFGDGTADLGDLARTEITAPVRDNIDLDGAPRTGSLGRSSKPAPAALTDGR